MSARSGIDRSKISRIERGQIERVPHGDLVSLARTLDARLELDLHWRGATLDRLIDEGHTAVVGSIVTWLSALSWRCLTEVSFSIWGERGSIDVLAIHPGGALAMIEAKRTVGDSNQTLIAIDRKVRLLPDIARERGLPVGPVAGLLVVASTTSNRRRIAVHAAVFRAALPSSAAECRRWLRQPIGSAPRGIVFVELPERRR